MQNLDTRKRFVKFQFFWRKTTLDAIHGIDAQFFME